MSWEYRIIEIPSTEEHWYRIHEVYYDQNDKIEKWSEKHIAPFGFNLEDLKGDLELMLRAFDLPVIKKRELEVGMDRIK